MVTLIECHAQSGDDQGGIKDLMHGLADYTSSKDIEHGHEIQPTLAGEDACGIGNPDLIGSLNLEMSYSIGCYGTTMAAVSGSRPIFRSLPGEDSLQAHEPGDAVASPRAAQHPCQSRAAVSLTTAHKLLADALTQLSVFQLARTWAATPPLPTVIAAARHQQGLAQPGNPILAAHLLDSGIPLGGTSERMPSDFFKTSRCSKSLAFSARRRRIFASSSLTLPPALRSLLPPLGSRFKCAHR